MKIRIFRIFKNENPDSLCGQNENLDFPHFPNTSILLNAGLLKHLDGWKCFPRATLQAALATAVHWLRRAVSVYPNACGERYQPCNGESHARKE